MQCLWKGWSCCIYWDSYNIHWTVNKQGMKWVLVKCWRMQCPRVTLPNQHQHQDTLMSRSDISQQAVPAPESSERGHRTPDTLQQPVDSLSLSCICVLSPATPDPSRQSDKNWALGAPGYEKPGVVGASLEVWKYADVVGIPKLGIPSLKTQRALAPFFTDPTVYCQYIRRSTIREMFTFSKIFCWFFPPLPPLHQGNGTLCTPLKSGYQQDIRRGRT